MRLAARLTASAQVSGEEVGERCEVESSAVARVEERADGRAPELVAELQVVPRQLPREVVNELPVGVNARAGHGQGRADGGDGADGVVAYAYEGQAEVLLRDACVEADARGVEVAVFGEEALFETVVAEARLVDARGRKDFQVRDGDEVDCRRRHGVVAGQDVSGEYGERERLIRSAVEVARGELVVLVEGVVKLCDEAVNIVRGARCDEEVGAARRVEERQRAVRSRPGVAREEFCDDWIRGAAQGGYLARVGHARSRVQADALALAFVGDEEESLVLMNRPSDASAELVVAEGGLRVGAGIEEVARVELVISYELEERAVEVVRAGLRDEVDYRAGVSTELGLEVREHGGLCD